MKFEEILPLLKKGTKGIRQSWSGDEEFIVVVNNQKYEGIPVTPYMLIKTSSEGYSSFCPTVCDILADDWQVVE